MAYTINANAKNVWIRDNEDTRDLSIQTDASSVYLDNGRTLEQELGEGSMVSNVATVDSAMSKVIDGTLDGAYESCVLKGQTLVNVLQNQASFEIYREAVPSYYNCLFDTNGLEANTKYYYKIFNKPTNAQWIISPPDSNVIDYFSYRTESDIEGTVTVNNSVRSKSKLWLKFENGETHSLDELNKVKVLFIKYQDGMENWDIPYFDGLCDVKMPILHNVGKNLFDINGDINQKFSYMAGGSGNVILGANSFRADSYSYDHHGKGVILNLKPNTTYTISGYVENRGSVNFMTGEWNPRHRVVNANGYFETTYTPADNEVETCISFVTFSTSSDPKAIFSNIQIEESTTPTTYEDHKTNILHTPSEVVLRSLPNGVKDTLNLMTGEYVQRIGEVTVDGTVGAWEVSKDSSKVFSYMTVSHIPNTLHAKGTTGLLNGGAICNRLHIDNPYHVVAYHNCAGVYERSVRIKLENVETTVEAYKSWLKSNPITVQYELAEPVTTIVEPSTMTPFAYQNGHVILESGYEGQSLLPTLEYSTVVNRTGQVESVAKTIQTQEKQLTMLEQMLIQNIIGLDYNNTVLALNLEINEVM